MGKKILSLWFIFMLAQMSMFYAIYTFYVCKPIFSFLQQTQELNQLMSWITLGLTTECVGCWGNGVKLILIWSNKGRV
jgi:uncharacterized membrane protein YadS